MKVTSGDIWKALKKRYCAPEWAIFPEVANGTGGDCRRHIDAMAFNFYPSRGLSIVAIEIKVDRGDLKRELITPDKAEEVACYCNEFWLAVPEGLITDQHEIPVTWGVMELIKDGSMRVKKRAVWFNRSDSIPKSFLMAVIRSCGKADDSIIAEVRSEAYKSAASHQSWELSRAKEELKKIEEKLKEFEKATGKSINAYTNIEGLVAKIRMAESMDEVLGKYGKLQVVRRAMTSFLQLTEEMDVFSKEAG